MAPLALWARRSRLGLLAATMVTVTSHFAGNVGAYKWPNTFEQPLVSHVSLSLGPGSTTDPLHLVAFSLIVQGNRLDLLGPTKDNQKVCISKHKIYL